MRNLLAFFAAMTITLLVVGYYLNWYTVRTTPAPSGQRSVTVDINTKKIGEDLIKAEQNIEQRLQKKLAADKAAVEKHSTPTQAPMQLPTPIVNIVND
jgi:hypothetical protein